MLKNLIACAVFTAALTCTAAYAADFDGYIIEISDNTPARIELQSADGANAEKITDNMYLVDTLEEAENFVDKQYIINICPNFEFKLHDDEEYFAPPNDNFYAQQWGLIKTNMPYAWKTGLNGEGVKIAIVDSGIDKNHEDLQGAKITDVYNLFDETKKDDVTDNYMHGTAVAGVIAAQRNNGIGIAGIADKAELAIIKITDKRDSVFDLESIIKAIDKAVEYNCDIVNLSLGTADEISDTEKKSMESMLKTTLDKSKKENNKEIIMIASVGNNGNAFIKDANGNDTQTPDEAARVRVSYPAGFDSVIGVASVDSEYKRSDFSQYNNSVFVTAPGSDVAVTVPDYVQTTTPNEVNNGYNKYILGNGTSFSAPFITGAAALAVQAANAADKAITIEKIQDILKRSVDNLGDDEGWDEKFGYGVINMKKFIGVLNQEYGVQLPVSDPTQPPHEDNPSEGRGIINQVVTAHPDNIHFTFEYEGETVAGLSMIGAVYDADGRMVKVDVFDKTELAETQTYDFNVDISEVSRKAKEGDMRFKMFILDVDSKMSMRPVLQSAINVPIAAFFTPSPETSASPSPEASASPSPEVSVSPSPEASVSPSPEVSASPSPETSVSPSPETSASPSPETSVSPSPETSVSPLPETSVSPSPETSVSPSPETSESPSPETEIPPATTGSSFFDVLSSFMTKLFR